MDQSRDVWHIGNVTVTRVVEIETRDSPPDLLFPGLKPEQVQKIRWLQPYFADPSGLLYTSIPSFIVESEDKRIIVDTGVGNDKKRLYPHFNERKGPFLTQLAEAGFPITSIDTVLCTHLHVDHVGWNTRLIGDRWTPTFPNARYLFGRIEWEYWHQRFLSGETDNSYSAKILDVQNVMKDSVIPIVEAGVHTLVETNHQITSEVSLISTPGHTPGHVSVLIRSNGQEAIITGDIMHHPIEIEVPDLPCNFDVDPKTAERTRIEFLKACSGRDTLVLGTHFSYPTAGRIIQNGKTWLFDTSLVLGAL